MREHPSAFVSGLAISVDDVVFLSHSHDAAMRVVELETGQLLRKLEGPTSGILASCSDGTPHQAETRPPVS